MDFRKCKECFEKNNQIFLKVQKLMGLIIHFASKSNLIRKVFSIENFRTMIDTVDKLLYHKLTVLSISIRKE